MAELIDKSVALKLFDNCGLSMSRTFVKNRISNMPTTTEAEIRAKAYDKLENIFIDKWSGVEDALSCDAFVNILVKVAEQLKEE